VKKNIFSEEADLLDLSKEILKKRKSIRFQAKGWSMRPFIQDGDFITVSPVEDSSLKPGDVVLYVSAGNQVIVHRIIKKYKRHGKMTLLIKGDASLGSPEKVDVQNVLGEVTVIERNGRKKRLDAKSCQIIGLFFVGISPFSQWIYPVGSVVKRCGRSILGGILEKIQGFKFYSFLVKKLMKENVHYQIVSSDDAFSLSQLYRSFQGLGQGKRVDALDKKLKSTGDSDYCTIATRKGRVIGSVTLNGFPESDHPYEGWWIFGLWVSWRCRGMGIGEKLVKLAVEKATEVGSSEVKLLAFEDAKRAINLYKKLGFRHISIPELDKQLAQEAKETLRRRIILVKDLRSR
jgi:signal peptidase I